MSPKQQRKIVGALKRIVGAEMLRKTWRPKTWRQLEAIRRLAAKAQQMGLSPQIVLSDDGRAAMTVIAHAIGNQEVPNEPLNAEWRLIINMTGPEGQFLQAVARPESVK